MERETSREVLRRINLQLFANPNTQTTTTSASGNDLSPEMKTYYDSELIEMAGPNLVHHQFGMKKPIPKGRGKKIEFRKFSNFKKATTPLTEGVTPDGNKMDVKIIEKEVSQYGDYVTISDVLELTAIDDFILEATDKHGQNAGLTLDTICRNEINAGTNVRYAQDDAGAEITSRSNLTEKALLTPDLVAKAVADLKANNTPKIDGYYVGIIHPYVAYDLMRNKEWIDVAEYAGSTQIFEGEIGKLYGVRFVETTEAKIWKSAADDCPKINASGSATEASNRHAVFSTLFIGKDAYANIDVNGGGLEVIVHQKGSGGTADPLNQRSTVGWKATYATAIRIPEYIVRVESLSAYSKEAEVN